MCVTIKSFTLTFETPPLPHAVSQLQTHDRKRSTFLAHLHSSIGATCQLVFALDYDSLFESVCYADNYMTSFSVRQEVDNTVQSCYSTAT